MATRTVETVAGTPLLQKVVAESAMLLVCAEHIGRGDVRARARLADVAALLTPHARGADVLSAICLDPGLALDHAVAHVLLTRLGYPDKHVDRLLAESLALGVDFGPERSPHQLLERQWLARMSGTIAVSPTRERRDLADSMLGRAMDALGSNRFDIYGFTHAAMYASDLGERRFALPRSARAITADAEAALAFSLDSNDFDLTAELVLTWPMLGLAWSPSAVFAFRLVAEVEDELGFLPGIQFDRARYEAVAGEQASQYVVQTSYHPTLVMGFLCAIAARPGCAPPREVPPAKRSRGAGAAIVRRVADGGATSRWTEALGALDSRRQDSLAPLGLASVLRRARTKGDVRLVHEALELALAHDLIDAPAPRQAVALLRRTQALDAATTVAAIA